MAVQSHARPLRVLYLHGFEETADSPKPQALIKDPRFDVLIPPLKVILPCVLYSTRGHE
jgi:hypothetical protein